MTERFYLPQPLDRPEVTLSGTEAHHLAHVLRIAAGSTVVLFDGEGAEAVAEVLAVSKRDAILRPRTITKERDVAPRVTLAVAPPKGDRFRWLVEKATELGVARLVPLLTRRTVVDPRESKLDKLRQTVIAACKQCGRNRLMELTEPTRFEALLSKEASAAENMFLLHPHGKALRFASDESIEATVTLLIGPEGGFTEEEIEQASDRGIEIAALSRTILRTETAAIAAAAIATHTLAGPQSLSS